MIVVADTCSLLMLLRLNPEMLVESQFGCCTTQEVRDEILRTTKFANQYPWRVNFRDKLKVFPQGTVINTRGYHDAVNAVKVHLSHIAPEEGVYNLSREDCSIIILAQILPDISSEYVADDIAISTMDCPLRNFAERRFELGNVEPLGILNLWIEKGLWHYDEKIHRSILQEWADNEPRQSIAAKKRFQELTGKSFPK